MEISKAIGYARSNRERFLGELKDFLRIPSVSTLPEHRGDMVRAAEWVAADFRRIGLEHVELIPVEGGHALVYADWLHAPGRPTVLCYGHYDVQPVDPLGEWTTPPFEPSERDGNLYARGSADDKGQMLTHSKALESLMLTHGGLPVNVRMLIEGEEEVGGGGVEAFIQEHPERLACDVALVSDTAMQGPGQPSLTVGLRGLCYVEVEAWGPSRDLHSGGYGGASPNPLFALCQIIARLKDDDGRVLIPGFYDKVKAPTEAELKAWKSLNFDEERFRREEIGSSELTGETGFSALYRTWARPTFEVHGIPGGFTGAGGKTVIPARAAAKLSMRLVPDQEPQEIYDLLRAYVQSITPRGIRLDFRLISLAEPVVVSTDNPFVRVAAKAMHDVYGKDTVYIRSGGSIPIVAAFESALKAPTLLMGFCLPDCGAHGPDEKMSIREFYAGIESVTRFFEGLGRDGANGPTHD